LKFSQWLPKTPIGVQRIFLLGYLKGSLVGITNSQIRYVDKLINLFDELVRKTPSVRSKYHEKLVAFFNGSKHQFRVNHSLRCHEQKSQIFICHEIHSYSLVGFYNLTANGTGGNTRENPISCYKQTRVLVPWALYAKDLESH
jgi:hypothetical protein